jgi:hypothetical protein
MGVRRFLPLIAVAAVIGGLAIGRGEARTPNPGKPSSRVGPVSHRLLSFLISTGPFTFRLASSGAMPVVTSAAAIRDARRYSPWRPASAEGISLVRFRDGTVNVPASTLAWLVSVQPRKPVYDGSKTSRGPAGNYFVVFIRARDGCLLAAAAGYSPTLANRSGSGGWGMGEVAGPAPCRARH